MLLRRFRPDHPRMRYARSARKAPTQNLTSRRPEPCALYDRSQSPRNSFNIWLSARAQTSIGARMSSTCRARGADDATVASPIVAVGVDARLHRNNTSAMTPPVAFEVTRPVHHETKACLAITGNRLPAGSADDRDDPPVGQFIRKSDPSVVVHRKTFSLRW